MHGNTFGVLKEIKAEEILQVTSGSRGKKKHRKISKTTSSRIHAKKRFRERFGLRLKNTDLHRMEEMVFSGETSLLEVQSNRVSIHRLLYNKSPYTVVFDSIRKCIITVLPDTDKRHASLDNAALEATSGCISSPKRPV